MVSSSLPTDCRALVIRLVVPSWPMPNIMEDPTSKWKSSLVNTPALPPGMMYLPQLHVCYYTDKQYSSHEVTTMFGPGKDQRQDCTYRVKISQQVSACEGDLQMHHARQLGQGSWGGLERSP